MRGQKHPYFSPLHFSSRSPPPSPESAVPASRPRLMVKIMVTIDSSGNRGLPILRHPTEVVAGAPPSRAAARAAGNRRHRERGRRHQERGQRPASRRPPVPLSARPASPRAQTASPRAWPASGKPPVPLRARPASTRAWPASGEPPECVFSGSPLAADLKIAEDDSAVSVYTVAPDEWPTPKPPTVTPQPAERPASAPCPLPGSLDPVTPVPRYNITD